MPTRNLHPWQENPAGLLQFAEDTSRLENQLNQLVAFLLLDVCVETTMRTFLSLPDDVVSSKLKYLEKRKFSEGNFHELTKGVEAACVAPLQSNDLRYAKYYHAMRNQLYHQRSGITISADNVKRYAVVAASLLKQLLGVDHKLNGCPPFEANPVTKEKISRINEELPKNLERFKELITTTIEAIEPKLVLPTTIKKLSSIASNITPVSFPRKLIEFRKLIESCVQDKDIKNWLLDLSSNDIEGDSEQTLLNTQFLMEAGQDHHALYSLIVGLFFLPIGDVRSDSVDKYEDISFLDGDDYSIMGIYTACLWFEKHFASTIRATPPENEVAVIERGVELNDKLSTTINRLNAL